MNTDRVSGGVLLLFAAAVGWEAWKLPFGTINAPDSGFFPLSLAVALALLSALIVLATWLSGSRATTPPSWQGGNRVALLVVALVAYVAVLNPLGYLLATALVMLLYLRGLERVRWRVSLTVAVVSVVASDLLFRRLGVPLPAGILPF
ncbi:MAG: tripartite tricarboxylate transporter TctB family protein [Betaproteobacteria bacterium]|nr:tripartite tricarboxylate transporter TctB family protein [Betaproteobacteria bacterium]